MFTNIRDSIGNPMTIATTADHRVLLRTASDELVFDTKADVDEFLLDMRLASQSAERMRKGQLS